MACAPPSSKKGGEVLLFAGRGTSANDVAAVEAILKARRLSYSTADSRELNGMSEEALRRYHLLIIPGGNYIHIGNGLSRTAVTNIHNAVQGGLNYLGICAGGLLAGNRSSNGLNLAVGLQVDFYGLVNQGIHKGPVAISGPGVPKIEHYWEDGPRFSGWGAVVGKYPDGSPAIVQGHSGKGWVLLCGTHPEAPESWRQGMSFTTPTDQTKECAGALILSALRGTPLPHF